MTLSSNANNSGSINYSQHKGNLSITNDLTTGNILFSGEKHNISPQVLGSLVAEEDPRSSDVIPRVRIKRMNDDGTLDRYLIRKKPAFRIFSFQEGDQAPGRVSMADNRAQMIVEVLDYLNNLFTEIPATTSTILDFGPDDTIDASRDATNTTVLFDNGKEHAVNAIQAVENTIGLINVVDHATSQIHFRNVRHDKVTITGNGADNTVQGVINALNALFTVNPLGAGYTPTQVLPTLAGEQVNLNLADELVPATTDPQTGGQHIIAASGVGDGTHHSRAWSNEFIDEPGEYFDFRITGEGKFLLGAYEVGTDEAALAEGTTGDLESGAYWAVSLNDFGDYLAPQAVFGSNATVVYGSGWNGAIASQYQTNGEVQSNHENGFSALWRLSIDNAGYLSLSYFDANRTNAYVLVARRTQVHPAGVKLGLLIKCVNGNATLVDVPMRTATDPSGPALTWHYIESPDGVFTYPLFQTVEEANYVDEEYGTAADDAGQNHSHMFADELPTSQTWYMPNTYMFHSQTSAPTPPSGVVYNEIATGADANYAPSQFGPQTITVDEGSAVNLQVVPTGDASTYSLTGIPAGLAFNGSNLVGTAPEVAGDNVATPTQDHVITVTKANHYGSSVGTLTVTVANLTAPVIDTGDFTLSTGSIVAGVLQADSVANHSVTLAEGERVIIPQAWVDAHIAPNARAADEKVFLGLLRSDATMSSIQVGDFAGCVRWAGRADANSHEVRINDQVGASVGNQTFINNGSSLYSYALEKKGGELWLLAGTLSDLNSQHSAAEGGTFARQLNCGLLSDNGLTGPHTIVIGTFDNAVVDLDDALTTDDIFKVNIPAPPVNNLTPWTKAIDFSGSNEHVKQADTITQANALRSGGYSTSVANNSDSTKTVDSGFCMAWMTAVVFKSDGNNSNQHIWNCGAGAGNNDVNVYLRIDASGNLYFGWGQGGNNNECAIASSIGTDWKGVYIAWKGGKFSYGDLTTANLADAFDIRVTGQSDSWAVGSNLSVPANWTTGSNMTLPISDPFTVGGRGSNRNFHGQVASMVISTLKRNDTIPDATEIAMVITDPVKWVDDYKVGDTYRYPNTASNYTNFQVGDSQPALSTQVWLMGDGVVDSYGNGIRNYVAPTYTNFVPLILQGMVSNDIQTVNINGLS